MFRKQFFTISIVLALILLSVNLKANTQSTAKVTGLDKVTTCTLPAPYNETVYCGTFTAVVDGNNTSLYCIDITHSLIYNDAYNDVSQTDVTLSYILNNYYPFKTGYAGEISPIEFEAGAVQLSLWHFTDGLDVNLVTNVDASVNILKEFGQLSSPRRGNGYHFSNDLLVEGSNHVLTSRGDSGNDFRDLVSGELFITGIFPFR